MSKMMLLAAGVHELRSGVRGTGRRNMDDTHHVGVIEQSALSKKGAVPSKRRTSLNRPRARQTLISRRTPTDFSKTRAMTRCRRIT